jgi:hypothetical protein
MVSKGKKLRRWRSLGGGKRGHLRLSERGFRIIPCRGLEKSSLRGRPAFFVWHSYTEAIVGAYPAEG